MTASVGVITTSALPAQASPGDDLGNSTLATGTLVTTEEQAAEKDTAEKSTAEKDAAEKSTAEKAAAGKARLSKAARQQVKAAKAVKAAKQQVGDPYRYGASGPGAFDCSGLTSFAWRKAGVRIPRVAAGQYRNIRKKVSWKDLKPGDLLFFRGLGHVGMYVGKGKWVHSPRSGLTVRVEKLSGYRKRSFVGAVRPGI